MLFFIAGHPNSEFEYMRIPIKLFPVEIIEEYNLLSFVSDGRIYMEIYKGVYGLPPVAILANHLIVQRLALHGGHTVLSRYLEALNALTFYLVVDDVGVRYMIM
jgi:hypothetical protein